MIERKYKRGASLDLDGAMSHRQIADALAAMIFNGARDWTRTVRMDRPVRDLIVRTLRATYMQASANNMNAYHKSSDLALLKPNDDR